MADVLLIGDGADRAGLQARLEADGHRVSYLEKLSDLRSTNFEFDLLATKMPNAEQEEAMLAGLLRTSRSPALIMLLQTDSLEEARAAYRLGASDLLPPNPSGDQLAEAVDYVIRSRRLPSDDVASQAQFAGVQPEELPRSIVDAACRVLQADAASLMLLGGDNRLHMACSAGPTRANKEIASLALGERVAGRIALSGEPAIIVGAVEVDPRFGGVSGQRDVRSSIVYPLRREAQLLGVLSLNRSEGSNPFSARDLSRTSVFANQVVLALENVRLLRQVAAGEGMAAVGRIAEAVAHNINNPAGIVISSLSYVKECLQAPRVSRAELIAAIDDARVGMDRIRDIVRDFQLLTQGGGKRESCLNLDEVIRSASRVAGAVLHRAAVRLELEPGLVVIGSRSGLAQAFVNLILNAGAEESPDHNIVIRCRRAGDQVELTVSDSGRAISPTQLATLFEPTFGTRGVRSAGLGLAISRDIVQAHGGELVVRSQEGEGTVLTVRLPAADVLQKTA